MTCLYQSFLLKKDIKQVVYENTKEGYKMYSLKIRGLRRRLTFENLTVLKDAINAKKEAKQIENI